MIYKLKLLSNKTNWRLIYKTFTSLQRQFSISSRLFSVMSLDKVGKEIKIPVPWGHILGVEFGNHHGFPILMMHGWQDNLNTFATLAPLLPPEFHYVAIDLPGHGFSSHKPPGTFYHFIDYVVDVKRVIDYLKWTELSFVSHSLGALMSMFFASLFPSMVKAVINLDVITLLSVPDDKMAAMVAKSITEVTSFENSKYVVNPLTKDEALARLMQANTSINAESAALLLERGIHPFGNGELVTFSRDFRVKMTVLSALQRFSLSQVNAIFSNIKCKFMLIRAILNNDGSRKVRSEREQEIMDILSNCCKQFEYVEVEGSHFVHLTNPSLVAPHIQKFLTDSMLSSPTL